MVTVAIGLLLAWRGESLVVLVMVPRLPKVVGTVEPLRPVPSEALQVPALEGTVRGGGGGGGARFGHCGTSCESNIYIRLDG